MRKRVGYLFLVSTFLAGCAHQNVVDPGSISLSKALTDTVDALADAREKSLERKTNFRFYGCTVTAVFNVNATANADNKLSLGINGGPPAAIAPVTINLTGSQERSETGTRGNTVTVVLATPDCLPGNAAAAADPAGGAALGGKKKVKKAGGGLVRERGDPVVREQSFRKKRRGVVRQ